MSVIASVSYGGGKQSTGLLVLAAQGKLPIRTFLFANVGDDSESPYTIAYVNEIAIPYARAHGLDLKVLQRHKRDTSVETLYGRLVKPGSRSLPIPVRMPNTGAPGTRSCTLDFKIRVIGAYLKAQGASESNKAVVAVGISSDEVHRVNNRRAQPYERLAYPLIGMLDGSFNAPEFSKIDTPMSRVDCEAVIAAEPLPGGADGPLANRLREVFTTLAPLTQADLLGSGFTRMPRPDKSACYFCPFHRPAEWLRMRRQSPDQFQKAVELENLLNGRRDELGRDHVYFTRFGKPLAEAIPEVSEDEDLDGWEILDDGASCDNGFCMT
jgi:hypothetical protein